MNVVDLILVAILACVTLHFYFRKKKKALSSGKEKEKPIREAGLAVLKKLISNHERTKEAIITYITALVTWLIIWQLL